MASNKNALIRYNTIDKCLKNPYKKYTLEDLIQACSDALYEFEGKNELISKRTIQLDIQNMRSEKLGYNAPIEVYEKKFYRYADPDFSIKNIPLNENDLQTMNNAVQILKQFKDFSALKEMNGILEKLEDSLSSHRQKSIIHLEKNEQLKGLEFINILYQSILDKKALRIHYQSFKAREVRAYDLHPQLLKEYNNRWFLLAWYKTDFMILALDRIKEIGFSEQKYIDQNVNGDEFFKEVIGVTVSKNQPAKKVIFKVDKNNAPYIQTKPFHHSQTLVNQEDGFSTFEIMVQINPELERLILGFGEGIEVISPEKLRQKIQRKLKKAVGNYEVF